MILVNIKFLRNNLMINLKIRTSQSSVKPTKFMDFEQRVVFNCFDKHYATGRIGSVIQSLQEPAYKRESPRPAWDMARMLWHAVIPEPQ